jgi:hypothetical protein
MTPKTLLRLAIALGVVLLLWGALALFSGRNDEIESMSVIAAVIPESVDTVEFLGREDTVRLYKSEDGSWTVNGYTAAAEEIDTLFTALAEAPAADLVARSPSSHARMGVVDTAAIRFRIVSGGETATHLLVGERGRAFQSRYVRPQGEDRVFLLVGKLAGLVDRSVSDWRDKLIVAVEPDSVARFTVAYGRRRYTVVRRDSVWSFADGAATDSARVRRALEAYRRLVASGGSVFASPAQVDSIDFDRPDRRAVLVSQAGDTLADLVFDSTSTGFWARRASGGTVYHLLTWKVNDAVPADSAVRKTDKDGR